MNKNSEVARKMSYSIDLRKRVVDYVEKGGRIAQAAGLFQVGRATIYRWLGRTDRIGHKGKKTSEKTRLASLTKGCKRESRFQINRQSKEVWSKTKCHILCS